MAIENTIQQLTGKFLNSLTQTLQKDSSQHEILLEPSLHIMLHMISCTQALRDKFSTANKSKYSLNGQLFQPFLNGLLALFGKILMDSFTTEPKLSDIDNFTQGFGVVSKHILTLFPEMAIKKHKTSGKMLIHHAVFKARPAIAEDTVRQILSIHPDCASARDSSGALPLHWATRNDEITTEVLDILIKSAPDSPAAADNKGFLPLHWAVNQDTPHIEVVRQLLKVYPKAASTPSFNGYLPIHYCVLRDRPSSAAIKAVMSAYPEGIRTRCTEGNLPLHLYLHREQVDSDVLRLLINYYPEGLQMTNHRNQLPLHMALDVPMPNLVAIQLVLKEYPEASQQQDIDGYLPFHLSIDNAYPNYTLATHILHTFPTAAQYCTKDGMLPLHLVVSTNHNPPAPFVGSVIAAFPEGIYVSVTDVVPAVDMSMSEPDSWSGDWCEKQWTPLSKAKDRNMENSILNIFYKYGNMIKSEPNKYNRSVITYTRPPGVDVLMSAEPSPRSAGASRNSANNNSTQQQQMFQPQPQPQPQQQQVLRGTQPIKTIQSLQGEGNGNNNKSSTSHGGSGNGNGMGIELQHNKPIISPQSQEIFDKRFNNNNDNSNNDNSNSNSTTYSQSQGLNPPATVPHHQSASKHGGFFPTNSSNNNNNGPTSARSEDTTDFVQQQWNNNNNNNNNNQMSHIPGGTMHDNFMSGANNPGSKPASKLPPNILKAQMRAAQTLNQQQQQQQQQSGRDESPQGLRLPQIQAGNNGNNSNGVQIRMETPPGAMRAPPQGPIPQALLAAAENNALRYAKVHGDGGGGVGVGVVANNRKYLNKVNQNQGQPSQQQHSDDNVNRAGLSSATPSTNTDSRTTTADDQNQSGTNNALNNSNVGADNKANRLLAAQQVYVKRGINNNNSTSNANNNTNLMSTTGVLQSTSSNNFSSQNNNPNMTRTMPLPNGSNGNGKVYLKPTAATAAAGSASSSSTNNTNEIIKSLGINKVRVHPTTTGVSSNSSVDNV